MKERIPYFAPITTDIILARDITDAEKLLIGLLSALTMTGGACYATNQYLADLTGKTKKWVSEQIQHLVKTGYITTNLIKDPNTNEVQGREIFLNFAAEIKKYVRGKSDPLPSQNTIPPIPVEQDTPCPGETGHPVPAHTDTPIPVKPEGNKNIYNNKNIPVGRHRARAGAVIKICSAMKIDWNAPEFSDTNQYLSFASPDAQKFIEQNRRRVEMWLKQTFNGETVTLDWIARLFTKFCRIKNKTKAYRDELLSLRPTDPEWKAMCAVIRELRGRRATPDDIMAELAQLALPLPPGNSTTNRKEPA